MQQPSMQGIVLSNMKYQGTVQSLFLKKGYGYVHIPATREAFFFDLKKAPPDLQKGEWVEFEIRENKQGLYAAQLQRLDQ